MPILETEYRGASLRVEIDSGHCSLSINNIERAQAPLIDTPGSQRLSSAVQTDYEWHEFIEALITLEKTTINIQLIASNAEIASQHYPDYKADNQT